RLGALTGIGFGQFASVRPGEVVDRLPGDGSYPPHIALSDDAALAREFPRIELPRGFVAATPYTVLENHVSMPAADLVARHGAHLALGMVQLGGIPIFVRDAGLVQWAEAGRQLASRELLVRVPDSLLGNVQRTCQFSQLSRDDTYARDRVYTIRE